MPSATCARDFEAISNTVKKARNLSFMKEILVRRYYAIFLGIPDWKNYRSGKLSHLVSDRDDAR